MIGFKSQPAILWRQVWGLAALQAAITFSWMAYGICQPKLLGKLDFTELAGVLLIVQGLLGAVIEPLVGGLSDKLQRQMGSRFPLINIGVILTGLIFVSVALAIQLNPPAQMRWLFPVMMVVWLAAMKIFQTPAISLLSRYAPPAELPQANAILTLVSGLVGALGPFTSQLIDALGGALTFLLGGIILVLAAAFMRSLTPTNTQPSVDEGIHSHAPISLLSLIFGVGLSAGLQVNLLTVFPSVLQTKLPAMNVPSVAAVILLVSGVSAIFLGKLAVKLGNWRALLLGLGAMTGLMALTLSAGTEWQAVGAILGLGAALSLIYNTGVPFALSMVPARKAGLGTGLFLGGGGAATALFAIFNSLLGGITPAGAVLGAAIAFGIACVCVGLSQRVSTSMARI